MQKIITSIAVLSLLIVGGVWFYMTYQPPLHPQQLISAVSYQCDSGKSIQASYYQGSTTPVQAGEPPVPNGSVALKLSDGRSMTLSQTISGSGIRYANTDESIIFWSKGNTAFVLEKDQQTYTNCLDQAMQLSQDLYPLYGKAQWEGPASENVTIGTSTFVGPSITSDAVLNTMDPGSVFTPFEQYYAQKLASLGWKVDNKLAAGGHVGGQTGYLKDSRIILTRFSIKYHTMPQNAPSECPCDVTLSLFSSRP